MAGHVASQTTLDLPLRQQLDLDRSILLLQYLWQETVSLTNVNKYQSYLKYYSDEIRRLQFGFPEESRLLSRTAAQTHADVIKVIMTLSEHRDLRLSKVRERVKAIFQGASEEAIQHSIDLALRVWLTLNVRNESELVQIARISVPSIRWENESE